MDIWPLYLFHPGAQTLNAAISIRATASLVTREDHRIVIQSTDTGQQIEADDWRELRDMTSLRLLALVAHAFRACGVTLTTHSESPAGAGLGGSSALNIACCAAFSAWQGLPQSDEALVRLAMDLEAAAIGVPTGLQDYRPAMYGGIAALELGPGDTPRVPLRIEPARLEERLVLCYTGKPRASGTNNWAIFKRHLDGDAKVRKCFDGITHAVTRMRVALESEDWDGFAEAVTEEWDQRKQLAPAVTTPVIDGLIESARAAGAMAAKVCGAGGGGCLVCVTPPDRRDAVSVALGNAGARVLPFHFDPTGLTRG